MKCLVLSCVFPPEPVVSSQTSAQVARALVERGHEITVITGFPNRPGGRIHQGYSRKLVQREKHDGGFQLVRCFSVLSPESRITSRFLENVSFGVTSGCLAFAARKPDVIYANTWPVFALGILSAVACFRNIPLVVSVQDIYPESLLSQNRIRAKSWVPLVIRWIDGLIARHSRALIVISASFAKIYRETRGVPSARMHIVPNWVDSASIVPDDKGASGFRVQRSIPSDAFLAVYGGNIGRAAGVETMIESFQYLRDDGKLYAVIAGEGSNLGACVYLANERNCPRVLFHSPWLKEDTSMLLSAADVLVLPTRSNQSLASVPSKLLAYMLAARPVIALALPESDLANMILDSGCGWVLPPDQPEVLAAKIRQVASMAQAERRRCGMAGREFALRNFTSQVCLPRVISVLENATSQVPISKPGLH
jgi:colanic acid biosynthesis glycosyl transferase WcaI